MKSEVINPENVREKLSEYEAQADHFRHRGMDGIVKYYEDKADACRLILDTCKKVEKECEK